MFIEALNARRLMSVTGLDPTFASGGIFNVAKTINGTESAIAAGNGSYFVEVSNGNTYYALKLSEAGVPDTAFGDKGYAMIPTQEFAEPTAFAYDARRDLLYVAGTNDVNGYDRVIQMTLTRLRPDGKVDTSFGDKGTFTYSPPPSADFDNDSVTADIEAINVLNDGSVVLAVDRNYSHYALGTTPYPNTTQYGLCLLKLRSNGTRDVGYGSRGLANLMDGYALRPDYSYDGTAVINRGFFGDVQTDAAGVTRVLMRHVKGTRPQEVDIDTPDDITGGLFEVKSRTVSANGVVDPTTAHSWKLFDSTGDGHDYAVPYLGYDGGVVKVVVDSRSDHAHVPLVYTLRPGVRAKSRPLDVGGVGTVDLFVHSASGDYYAVDRFGDYTSSRVIRLTPAFTLDPAFGKKGAAVPGIEINGLFADDNGRLLVTENEYEAIVERLD